MGSDGAIQSGGADPFAAYRALLDGGPERTNVALEDSARAAHHLLHSIATPVFIKDNDSRFVACNAEFAAYAGLTPAEVIGLTDQDMPWGPVSGATYVNWDQHVLTTGEPVTGIEEPILTAEGSTRWLETDKVPLTNDEGATIGVIGSFRDITDRRELRQTLLDMATAVATIENMDALLDEVVASIQRVLTAEMIAVLMVGDDGNFELERHVTCPDFDVSAASSLDFSWLSPLLHAGVQNGATLTAGAGDRLGPAQSTLAAVMVVSGKPVGLLLLESSTLNLLAPSSAHRLGAIAGQASATISALDRSSDAELNGADDERERLAQELHDSVLQTSWSVSLLAHAGLQAVEPDHPTERIFQRIKVAANQTQDATRSLVLDRSPSELARIPLRELVDNAITAFSDLTTTTVSTTIEDVDADPEERIALYRIAQEALNNVLRHAHATEVSVQLERGVSSGKPTINLVISDNGVGFDSTISRPGHLGLGIMSSRAQKVGGKLTIRSSPGEGTIITAKSAQLTRGLTSRAPKRETRQFSRPGSPRSSSL